MHNEHFRVDLYVEVKIHCGLYMLWFYMEQHVLPAMYRAVIGTLPIFS